MGGYASAAESEANSPYGSGPGAAYAAAAMNASKAYVGTDSSGNPIGGADAGWVYVGDEPGAVSGYISAQHLAMTNQSAESYPEWVQQEIARQNAAEEQRAAQAVAESRAAEEQQRSVDLGTPSFESATTTRRAEEPSRGAAYETALNILRGGGQIDPYLREKAIAQGLDVRAGTPEEYLASRQTVPVPDYTTYVSQKTDEKGNVILPVSGDSAFYRFGKGNVVLEGQYGSSVKTFADPVAGKIATIEQLPGRSITNLIGGGGDYAAQSGSISIGRPTSPLVYERDFAHYTEGDIRGISTKWSTPEYQNVLAHPELYSRPGAEAYAGQATIMDDRTLYSPAKVTPAYGSPEWYSERIAWGERIAEKNTAETPQRYPEQFQGSFITPAVQISRYPRDSGILANYVTPAGVYYSKTERPDVIPDTVKNFEYAAGLNIWSEQKDTFIPASEARNFGYVAQGFQGMDQRRTKEGGYIPSTEPEFVLARVYKSGVEGGAPYVDKSGRATGWVTEEPVLELVRNPKFGATESAAMQREPAVVFWDKDVVAPVSEKPSGVYRTGFEPSAPTQDVIYSHKILASRPSEVATPSLPETEIFPIGAIQYPEAPEGTFGGVKYSEQWSRGIPIIGGLATLPLPGGKEIFDAATPAELQEKIMPTSSLGTDFAGNVLRSFAERTITETTIGAPYQITPEQESKMGGPDYSRVFIGDDNKPTSVMTFVTGKAKTEYGEPVTNLYTNPETGETFAITETPYITTQPTKTYDLAAPVTVTPVYTRTTSVISGWKQNERGFVDATYGRILPESLSLSILAPGYEETRPFKVGESFVNAAYQYARNNPIDVAALYASGYGLGKISAAAETTSVGSRAMPSINKLLGGAFVVGGAGEITDWGSDLSPEGMSQRAGPVAIAGIAGIKGYQRGYASDWQLSANARSAYNTVNDRLHGISGRTAEGDPIINAKWSWVEEPTGGQSAKYEPWSYVYDVKYAQEKSPLEQATKASRGTYDTKVSDIIRYPSDASRYSALETEFSTQPMLETSKSVIVPEQWSTTTSRRIGIEYSDAGTRVAYGDLMTGRYGSVRFSENIPYGATGEKKISYGEFTTINPYTGETRVTGQRTAYKQGQIPEFQFTKARFNIFDLPEMQKGGGGLSSYDSYITAIEFTRGSETAGAYAVGKGYGNVYYRTPAVEGFFEQTPPEKRITSDYRKAIEDMLSSESPERIRISSYNKAILPVERLPEARRRSKGVSAGFGPSAPMAALPSHATASPLPHGQISVEIPTLGESILGSRKSSYVSDIYREITPDVESRLLHTSAIKRQSDSMGMISRDTGNVMVEASEVPFDILAPRPNVGIGRMLQSQKRNIARETSDTDMLSLNTILPYGRETGIIEPGKGYERDLSRILEDRGVAIRDLNRGNRVDIPISGEIPFIRVTTDRDITQDVAVFPSFELKTGSLTDTGYIVDIMQIPPPAPRPGKEIEKIPVGSPGYPSIGSMGSGYNRFNEGYRRATYINPVVDVSYLTSLGYGSRGKPAQQKPALREPTERPPVRLLTGQIRSAAARRRKK